MRFYTYPNNLTYSYSWHDIFLCETWHILMHDMTHSSLTQSQSHVRHESFLCATWCGFIHVLTTWHIPIRDMTHSSLTQSQSHESFLCATWCGFIHILTTWHIPIRDMTHSSLTQSQSHVPGKNNGPRTKVDILQSQLPIEFTIEIDHRADFWEIRYSPKSAFYWIHYRKRP